MHAAEIVERDVQRDGGKVAIDLLAKAVAQSSEPLRGHADREILPLDIAGRNLCRQAALLPRGLQLLPAQANSGATLRLHSGGLRE